MGLFDDFDIDMDEVTESGSFDIEDGHYEFTISEALVQNGTKNKPNTTFLIIKYDLDEAGSHWEWFTLAESGDSTAKKAQQSLGFLKSRLTTLGFTPSALNDLDPEDFEGIQGTLELKTTNGKGANAAARYQNIYNVKVDEEGAEPAEEAPQDDSDSEIKKRVAARRAARAEAPATVKKAPAKRSTRAAADDTEEENPFTG